MRGPATVSLRWQCSHLSLRKRVSCERNEAAESALSGWGALHMPRAHAGLGGSVRGQVGVGWRVMLARQEAG